VPRAPPKYDDWSLPKGKLDKGESFEDAALREVWEETGLRCRLLQELEPVRYTDGKGRPKVVRYWLMEPLEDTGFAAQRRGRRGPLAGDPRRGGARQLRARPGARRLPRRRPPRASEPCGASGCSAG
jgi:8-oxo-dGTP pyrophosphatase MutT (NUDIX family)